MPAPLRSFLSPHDLAGKIIAPFITHGGFGPASLPETLAQLADARMGSFDVVVAEGLDAGIRRTSRPSTSGCAIMAALEKEKAELAAFLADRPEAPCPATAPAPVGPLPREDRHPGRGIEIVGELSGILGLGEPDMTKPRLLVGAGAGVGLGSETVITGARFHKFLPLHHAAWHDPQSLAA